MLKPRSTQTLNKSRSLHHLDEESSEDPGEQWTKFQEDLLQPQFYPDSSLFRSSLQNVRRDDIDLFRDLASHKTTIRVLAPYLRIMRKKILESATKTPQYDPLKDTLAIFERKHPHFPGVAPDIKEKVEMIVSIHETADVLKSLVKAKTVVSYIVDEVKNEIFQSPRYVESSTAKLTRKIEQGTTMAAYAAFSKEYVLSYNVTTDQRFPLGLGFSDSIMKYALCVPVKTAGDGEKVVAVYEMTRDAFDVPFSKEDIKIVLAVTAWMGVAILQNNLYSKLSSQQELSDYMIQLTSHYHAGNASFNSTLTDLVVFARDTIGAESCNIFTVSKKTEHTLTVEELNQGHAHFLQLHKRRTKRLVRNDGSMLCKVMMKLESFKNSMVSEVNMDMETGTRSVLCVPILSKNEAIGAIQLKNKKTAIEFDEADTKLLQMFASFCAINMSHLEVENQLRKSDLQTNINQEMLFHHIKACVHDEEEVKKYTYTVPDGFFTFSWYPSPDETPQLVELTITMMREVLGDTFMSLNNVPRFVLTVKNCYRPNPYHNFVHGFCVAHAMANIITRHRQAFTGVECKGLMVAALCHDVDHRGYNNHFLQTTNHYLSQLYDFSPLENHHFAVTKMIMHHCGMFKYFKPEVYNDLMAEIYENILATDFVNYFQSWVELKNIADQDAFTFQNPQHRRLVKSLMMTACDLSGQTKPMAVCQKTTGDIYEEFYHQGDIEKKMGFIPLPPWDRLKKDMVPENQVNFLRVVVIPCMDMVSRVFDTLGAAVVDAQGRVKQWQDMVEIKEHDVWKPEESYCALPL